MNDIMIQKIWPGGFTCYLKCALLEVSDSILHNVSFGGLFLIKNTKDLF